MACFMDKFSPFASRVVSPIDASKRANGRRRPDCRLPEAVASSGHASKRAASLVFDPWHHGHGERARVRSCERRLGIRSHGDGHEHDAEHSPWHEHVGDRNADALQRCDEALPALSAEDLPGTGRLYRQVLPSLFSCSCGSTPNRRDSARAFGSRPGISHRRIIDPPSSPTSERLSTRFSA